MHERLETIVIKVCESLPANITLFEKEGQCSKQVLDECKYCRQVDKDLYLCYKKTYTTKSSLTLSKI